jgi:hypothetical protein
MVKHALPVFMLWFSWLLPAQNAWALFSETSSDLSVLEDALAFKFKSDKPTAVNVTPMLVATPLHFWKESREDFAATAKSMLLRVFENPGDIIDCPECDSWRLHGEQNSRLHVLNGPLTGGEISALGNDSRYRDAKSIAFMKETPSGVAMTVVDLSTGRILFSKVADNTQNLTQAKPFLHLQAERERRMRGEALSYIFINLGFYPTGAFQVEWVEQWGSRNQHISGFGFSLFNPIVSPGIVYHYMLPKYTRFNANLGLYYPLTSAIANAVGQDQSIKDQFVLSGGLQWTFSSSIALAAQANTEGSFYLAFVFLNPLLFPFVL